MLSVPVPVPPPPQQRLLFSRERFLPHHSLVVLPQVSIIHFGEWFWRWLSSHLQ